MHLEHINMTVANIDRTIELYSALLGLRTRWSGLTSDGRRAAHLGTDHQYLALFEAEPGGPETAPQDYASVGLNHLGFVVDDLDAARERLESLGLNAHHEADYEPGRRVYFFDPDGIEVELVEYESAPTELPV